MPFGFFNTPASFQSYMNKFFAEKLNIFILVYLNNILIYIEDVRQSHIEVMRWKPEQLWKYSIYANHEDEIQFLSFVVLAQSIKIKAKKIKAVRDWPKLQSVRDIQMFLGFANFYKKFIKNFSRITTPLTSIFRTTDESTGNKTQTTSTKNVDGTNAAGKADSDRVDRNIENLSIIPNSAKSKKSKLT